MKTSDSVFEDMAVMRQFLLNRYESPDYTPKVGIVDKLINSMKLWLGLRK